ncbi:hypothetical protein PTSG_02632 [Salpingoeca rosetta]|uniref:Uncharacterized protein n=1 Tax=Salpingoeca rosetta (strain ATCC 50818 / BSB-021) TaxID=946362 RepID=F2U2V3_SALR5|nr:uncharacterized protein PTSG_02632 [Salpingoeca rosetta]EGD81947.1 hypothetical protein PTSG_02632 [Salpingoeca rosetta]|eukprot:XP_004996130.1 hypothetical protein PTSG_02632 [Salpingoeca rosetta]
MLFHALEWLNAQRIVLASGSPRRSELLSMLRLSFTVNKSQFDEKSLNKSDFATPAAFVQTNALRKAEEVAERMKNEFDLIIGSDTVVVQDDRILEKPESDEAAAEMIRHLAGKTHYVATGVALIFHKDGETVHETFCTQTDVTFAHLTDEEIRAYVATGDGHDKAGAYGIQSCAGALIESIQGDYYTVVGLPLHALCKRLVAWADGST